jgi:hypothetical protein
MTTTYTVYDFDEDLQKKKIVYYGEDKDHAVSMYDATHSPAVLEEYGSDVVEYLLMKGFDDYELVNEALAQSTDY